MSTNTNTDMGYDLFVADPLQMNGPGPLPNGLTGKSASELGAGSARFRYGLRPG